MPSGIKPLPDPKLLIINNPFTSTLKLHTFLLTCNWYFKSKDYCFSWASVLNWMNEKSDISTTNCDSVLSKSKLSDFTIWFQLALFYMYTTLQDFTWNHSSMLLYLICISWRTSAVLMWIWFTHSLAESKGYPIICFRNENRWSVRVSYFITPLFVDEPKYLAGTYTFRCPCQAWGL